MSTVEVYASGFQGLHSSLNIQSNYDISRTDFIRAMITVGAQNSAHFFSGSWWRGIPFRLFNGFACFSLLNFTGSDLALDPAFRDLDMSEKSATSYWMGMGFAKLTAERILNIPWLGHVDWMQKQGCLSINSSGGTRGDLAGLDNAYRWHVIEAKGRSQRVQPNVLQYAKDQAARITSINGTTPTTTSACITRLFTNPISILLDDPNGDDEGEQWKIDIEKFFNAYYSSLVQGLEQNMFKTIEIENQSFGFMKSDIFGEKYLIGLPDKIIKKSIMADKYYFKMTEKGSLSEIMSAHFQKEKHEISVGFDSVIAIHLGKL